MAVAQTSLMDPEVVLTVVIGTTSTNFDITAQVDSVEITEEATVLDRTTFGNSWRNKGRGLKSGSIKFDFYIDFDVDGTFGLFTMLWDDHEEVDFEVSDPVTGAAVTGTFVMSAVPSFAGKIDEYNKASLSFETTGEVTHVGGS